MIRVSSSKPSMLNRGRFKMRTRKAAAITKLSLKLSLR